VSGARIGRFMALALLVALGGTLAYVLVADSQRIEERDPSGPSAAEQSDRGSPVNPAAPGEPVVWVEHGSSLGLTVVEHEGRRWVEVTPAYARRFLSAWGIASARWGFIPDGCIEALEAVLASTLRSEGHDAVAARLVEYRRQYAHHHPDAGPELLVGAFFLDPPPGWERTPQPLGDDARSFVVEWDIREARVLRLRIGGQDWTSP
jgi:hypothetical protein